jgi:hypothetical protein
MEQLTLRSFTACGHQFILWIYGTIENAVPDGVEVRDAVEILPAEKVFCYRSGRFPGSYAGFSDIFRYKLLYEYGGWWTDMDVTCLLPLDFEQWYAFTPHVEMGLVGSVMKVPPKSDLMRRCFLWAIENVDSSNTDWIKPIRVLVGEVNRMGLNKFILPSSAVSPVWRDGEKYAMSSAAPHAGLHIIHWCNEWLISRRFDKNHPIPGTVYHALLTKHGLI